MRKIVLGVTEKLSSPFSFSPKPYITSNPLIVYSAASEASDDDDDEDDRPIKPLEAEGLYHCLP